MNVYPYIKAHKPENNITKLKEKYLTGKPSLAG